jgi:cell division protein FtsN
MPMMPIVNPTTFLCCQCKGIYPANLQFLGAWTWDYAICMCVKCVYITQQMNRNIPFSVANAPSIDLSALKQAQDNLLEQQRRNEGNEERRQRDQERQQEELRIQEKIRKLKEERDRLEREKIEQERQYSETKERRKQEEATRQEQEKNDLEEAIRRSLSEISITPKATPKRDWPIPPASASKLSH